jgi:hypothetical protein
LAAPLAEQRVTAKFARIIVDKLAKLVANPNPRFCRPRKWMKKRWCVG